MKKVAKLLKAATVAILIMALAAATITPTAAMAAPDVENFVPDDDQLLTRGPIHEAFAAPVAYQGEPGLMVNRQPPPNIIELPPDMKPDGDNIVWIPGYWFWDDEIDDFLWISGLWRDAPPNMQWIPGYWTEADEDGSYQWVAGYWQPIDRKTVTYLPAPPDSLEVGPSSYAPSDDYFYVPGYWVYKGKNYAWSPGYWKKIHPSRVYVPPHYRWTPAGYVFIDGYYDHPLENRGLLFVPVYIKSHAARLRTICYRPTIVIRTNLLVVQLFSRPKYAYYYFGDYFDVKYAKRGINPWYVRQPRNRHYDAALIHHRHYQTKRDPKWEINLRIQYQNRTESSNQRPPRTYAATRAATKHIQSRNATSPLPPPAPLATRINDLRHPDRKLQRTTSDHMRKATDQQKNLKKLAESRRREEKSKRSQLPTRTVTPNTRSTGDRQHPERRIEEPRRQQRERPEAPQPRVYNEDVLRQQREQAKQEQERQHKERQQQERERQQREHAERQQQERERQQRENVERQRQERDNQEREGRQRQQREKQDRENAERQRQERDNQEREGRQRRQREKQERENAERQRQERDNQEREGRQRRQREKQEREEQEKQQREKQEQERLRLEQEKQEQEKQERDKQQQQERERQQREHEERQHQERERQQREHKERQQQERERQQREHEERQHQERERQDREQKERPRGRR